MDFCAYFLGNFSPANRVLKTDFAAKSEHPSLDQRIAAMDKLQGLNLSCLKNVTLDGSANIISATDCAPPPTPGAAQVQAQAAKATSAGIAGK